MSFYMAYSAFRDRRPEAVLKELRRFLSLYGIRARSIPADPWEASDRTDVLLYAPRHRWCVVRWPEYGDGFHLQASVAISSGLRTLASTNGVHCDDVWEHALLDRGVLMDRFQSRPDYYSSDSPREARRLRERYRGDPETVGRLLGVEPALIARYFVHLRMDRLSRKPFPDDDCVLGDPWAFRNFWRRIGIAFPAPKRCALGVRMEKDFLDKLTRSKP